MDVIGSEIGQKMRSAIKAKLTEIGCYVDDELPDYVMVMVANKRTREQMEDDLQLFLATNTEPFVHWLHQVLTRLQEVTINTPALTVLDPTVSTKADKKLSSDSERSSSGKKDKSKYIKRNKEKSKDKHKKSKKAKKSKDGEKRKSHKSKKKDTDLIEVNIPPFLTNIERESEPSITDVFAGQILKNHGILMKSTTSDKSHIPDSKPLIQTPSKSRFPIIDPQTVTCPMEEVPAAADSSEALLIPRTEVEQMALTLALQPRKEQIREMNDIETKIEGLKKKLAEQMDSLSEDEDFLNIRTEAEELMGCELLGETLALKQPLREEVVTPPLKNPEDIITTTKETTLRQTIRGPSPSHNQMQRDSLPLIELNLPKRPLRERLSARPAVNMVTPMPKHRENQRITLETERTSPLRHESEGSEGSDRVSGNSSQHAPLKGRLGVGEPHKALRHSMSSVVAVRPRPRGVASSLLLRAVAEAHKSLLNIPPKIEVDSVSVKKALVLPTQRSNPKNIVIEVNSDEVLSRNMAPGDEYQQTQYVPSSLGQHAPHGQYVPTRRRLKPEPDTIANILNSKKNNEESGPQFVVTLDGLDPNMFLNKKLENEGIETVQIKSENSDSLCKIKVSTPLVEGTVAHKSDSNLTSSDSSLNNEIQVNTQRPASKSKKEINRSSNDTSPTANKETKLSRVEVIEKTPVKASESSNEGVSPLSDKVDKTAPVRKRKASPIIFDVKEDKKNKAIRDRTKEHVQGPPLKKYEVISPTLGMCRSFPACVFGAACAFTHPMCHWGPACSRRACPYRHDTPANTTTPAIASRVVPVSNYVGIKAAPSVCRFYPSCTNPSCLFLHPKPCRYGGACLNVGACNFYHAPNPALKWKSGV